MWNDRRTRKANRGRDDRAQAKGSAKRTEKR